MRLKLHFRRFPGKGWRIRWWIGSYCSAFYWPHGVHIWAPGWSEGEVHSKQ
jgi:hypothetical protein